MIQREERKISIAVFLVQISFSVQFGFAEAVAQSGREDRGYFRL